MAFVFANHLSFSLQVISKDANNVWGPGFAHELSATPSTISSCYSPSINKPMEFIVGDINGKVKSYCLSGQVRELARFLGRSSTPMVPVNIILSPNQSYFICLLLGDKSNQKHVRMAHGRLGEQSTDNNSLAIIAAWNNRSSVSDVKKIDLSSRSLL